MESLPFFTQLSTLARHPFVLAAVGLGTLVMLVAGVVGVPWVIVRLPPDYFVGGGRPRPVSRRLRPSRLVLIVLKNVAGLVLLLLGFAMLVLPGQGVLTLLVAVGLIDFPGKWRLERWIISRGPVHRLVNRIRERAGREPLLLPE